MKRVLFITLILASCAKAIPIAVAPSPCALILSHTEGSAPDCQKLLAAVQRAQARLAASAYRDAAKVSVNQVLLYRPQRYWQVNGAPYPLMILSKNVFTGDVTYVRGNTYVPSSFPEIAYSYEYVVEHEFIHAAIYLTYPNLRRTPEAIADQTPGYTHDGSSAYLYLVTCHRTIDDPFGEPGNTASCVLPYDGPVTEPGEK